MRRLLLGLTLALVGCNKAPSTDAPPTVSLEPQGTAPPIDHPPVEVVSSGHSRRLTIAQLRATFPVVLGKDAAGNPITWKVGTASGFDTYAATLGEADFIVTTEDNLEPSPLYLKLIDDASRDGCERALLADDARTDALARTLLRHVGKTDTVERNAAAVNANLRYLKLRFHGVRVEPQDGAPIEALRTLFDRAVKGAAGSASPTAAHVREGWKAVCVALLTSPEFHFY